jgi:phage tail-like protein
MASSDRQINAQVNAAYRFVVDIDGQRQAAFTECTLPTIEWETEEVKEGGANTFVHQLPSRRKSTKITLKNGLGNPELFNWYTYGMSEVFYRRSLTVTLLDPKLNPVLTWNVKDAYPVKWSGPQLKSDTSAIAIETLELVCGEITVT